MNIPLKKGFTLVELLVVIGILAVLATATVLILNPAEYLRQSRDATRVTDLNALNSAINLYITDQGGSSSFRLGDCPDYTGGRLISSPGTLKHTFKGASNLSLGDRGVAGTGWVDINFTNISGGSPLSRLPADPKGEGDLVYRYKCFTSGSPAKDYEINAVFESNKYNHTSAHSTPGIGLADSDGGDEPSSASASTTLCNASPTPVESNGTGCVYEVGNKLTL